MTPILHVNEEFVEHNDFPSFHSLQHQWKENGGDCGICGNPFDGERHNEAGGTYAKGIISRTYQEEDVITVTVTKYYCPPQGMV